MRAGAAKESAANAAAGPGGGGGGAPRNARPEPRGVVPLVFEQQHAEQALAVWSFAYGMHVHLSLTPFELHDFCRALEREADDSTLLAELHMRLLRVLLRDATALRASAQLPPPLEVGLLQQLPTAETVTPANWAEVLRVVGHLLRDMHADAAEAAAAAEARRVLGQGGYAALDFAQRLLLLRALCDATCGSLSEEIKANATAELEMMQEQAARMRELAKARPAPPLAAPPRAAPRRPQLCDRPSRRARSPGPAPARAAPPHFAARRAAAQERKEKYAERMAKPAGETKEKCLYYLAIAAPKAEGGGEGGGEGEGEGAAAAAAAAGNEAEAEERKERFEAATEGLLAALEGGEGEALQAAVAAAEAAGHEGVHADGRRWATSELKEARAVLEQREGREVWRELSREIDKQRRDDAQARQTALQAAPVRDELLGYDRSGRSYWILARDLNFLWVQDAPPSERAASSRAAAAAAASQSGTGPAWRWMYYEKVHQVRQLIGSLDGRGTGCEASLVARLGECLPLWEQGMNMGDEEEAPLEWQLDGHEWVGKRVMRAFKVKNQPEQLALGRITRWIKEDEEAGDGALFHAVHDDGDEEDLEEEEAREAIERYAATPEAELQALWRKAGVKYDNRLVRDKKQRALPAAQRAAALREELLELETSVLPALRQKLEPSQAWDGPARAGGGANPFRGSEREKWLRKVNAADSAAALAPHLLRLEAAVRQLQKVPDGHERKPWRVDGHEYVGCRARRFFDLGEQGEPMIVGNGTITGWLPAEGSEEALWHMVHEDDSDEEDLDEHEVTWAIANSREDRQAPCADEQAYLAKLAREAAREAKKKAKEEQVVEMDDDDEGEARAAAAAAAPTTSPPFTTHPLHRHPLHTHTATATATATPFPVPIPTTPPTPLIRRARRARRRRRTGCRKARSPRRGSG